jgi:hypothetical protein
MLDDGMNWDSEKNGIFPGFGGQTPEKLGKNAQFGENFAKFPENTALFGLHFSEK